MEPYLYGTVYRTVWNHSPTRTTLWNHAEPYIDARPKLAEPYMPNLAEHHASVGFGNHTVPHAVVGDLGVGRSCDLLASSKLRAMGHVRHGAGKNSCILRTVEFGK